MTCVTVVICLLDKAWPPQHSFVDGMLSGALAREPDIRVRLFVSFSKKADSKPRRYRGAACLPFLYPRRGVGRFVNLWVAFKEIRYQANRERSRGNRVVLFVRNEPIYLLAASLLRKRVSRLVFQSSFPHEEHSGNVVKRQFAKWMYRLAGHGVDVVTGVSPEGVARARSLFRGSMPGPYIPLLADLPVEPRGGVGKISAEVSPVFVYIGSHGTGRDMATVMRAIVIAINSGIHARFRFIGATPEDESRLRQVDGIERMARGDAIRFEPPVPRDKIPQILSECHIGISLIPPRPVYYESSPTKLAEYMGAGLAVLASSGIPMQERFVTEAHAGLLVEWDVVAIAKGIRDLASNPDQLQKFATNAREYANSSLQYRYYLSDFRELLGSR